MAMSVSAASMLLINRIALGAYMLLAGVGKVLGGVGNFYENSFKGLQPDFLPDLLARPYGYAIPFLEIAVGALLIVGLFTRWTAVVTTLMILSFTIALWMKVGFPQAGASGPFHPNVILMTLCLWVVVVGGGRMSLDHVLRKSQR